MVTDAAKRVPAVIATGGGAFLSARARRALGEHGLVCWLDATPTEIARRVREAVDGSERPLLAGDIETRLQELDDERRVAYSHADLWVPTQGLAPADVAERILRAWAEWRIRPRRVATAASNASGCTRRPSGRPLSSTPARTATRSGSARANSRAYPIACTSSASTAPCT